MNYNEWANFWRSNIGVNVIPSITATKKPKVEWKRWQTEGIPDDLHNQWIMDDMFRDGMAIICGEVFHNKSKRGLWVNGIDCDNKMGLDEMCPSGIDNIAAMTIVEQHANKDKCHILFYTREPLQSQAALEGDAIPKIEIKSGGNLLLYCTGGIHKDGSPIEIVGVNTIKVIEDHNALESRINESFLKYNLTYLKEGIELTSFDKPIYEVEGKLYEGSNRGRYILSYLDSKKIKNPELTEDDLVYFARKYEREHCVGVYDDGKIEGLVRQAMGYTEQIISERVVDSNDKEAIIDNTAAEIERRYKFVTLRSTDEILLYDGKIYNKAAGESIIKEECEKIIEHCKTGHRYEVLNKIKAQTYTDNDNFDRDPNIVVVPNGILNLETLELSEHTSNHLSRVLLPVEFVMPKHVISDDSIFEDIELNIGDTLFWKFLVRSFTINGKFRRADFEAVLEMGASVFLKRSIDEKAFMNLGGGENGKSVFLEYIESCLGEDNLARITLQDIAEDTFMRAELEGKSANMFTDLEQNELRRTGKIKAIISGEAIEVQRKHQQPFMLHPFCKMIFSCNRFPKVFDQSQGFFRRWIIVKWDRNFEGDPERDEHLKGKLKSDSEERSRVFSCLLFLARRLGRRDMFTHSKGWKENQRAWNSNADPVDGFVSKYVRDSESNTDKREMYKFYKEAMFERSEVPLGIGQFSKAFAEYYDYDIIKNDGTGGITKRVWLNVAMIKPEQSGMEEFDGTSITG